MLSMKFMDVKLIIAMEVYRNAMATSSLDTLRHTCRIHQLPSFGTRTALISRIINDMSKWQYFHTWPCVRFWVTGSCRISLEIVRLLSHCPVAWLRPSGRFGQALDMCLVIATLSSFVHCVAQSHSDWDFHRSLGFTRKQTPRVHVVP